MSKITAQSERLFSKLFFLAVSLASIGLIGCNNSADKGTVKPTESNQTAITSATASSIIIEAVEVKKEGSALVGTIKVAQADPTINYAFYVILNNEVVHKEWYQPANTFKFEVKIPGKYTIQGFARHEGEKEVFKISDPIVFDVNEIPAGPAAANEPTTPSQSGGSATPK